MAEIEIKLMQIRDGSRFLRVRLSSWVKPGFAVETDVPDLREEGRTAQAVFAAGGALAEHLGRNYNEPVDFDDIARQARETFRELMAEVRQRVA